MEALLTGEWLSLLKPHSNKHTTNTSMHIHKISTYTFSIIIIHSISSKAIQPHAHLRHLNTLYNLHNPYNLSNPDTFLTHTQNLLNIFNICKLTIYTFRSNTMNRIYRNANTQRQPNVSTSTLPPLLPETSPASPSTPGNGTTSRVTQSHILGQPNQEKSTPSTYFNQILPNSP